MLRQRLVLFARNSCRWRAFVDCSVLQESEIEKLCTDKFSIFRRCKLEEIDLPLLEGSLEDLSLDQLEVHTCYFMTAVYLAESLII